MSRLIPKVILGGITGIVAMDMSELCFYALDACVPERPKIQVKSANVVNNEFLEAKKVLKEVKQAEQAEDKKRDVWKRSIRIIVMALIAYMVVLFMLM